MVPGWANPQAELQLDCPPRACLGCICIQMPTRTICVSQEPACLRCLFSFIHTIQRLVVQVSLLIRLISATPAAVLSVPDLSMDQRRHPTCTSGERHGGRETWSTSTEAAVDHTCGMSLCGTGGDDFGLSIHREYPASGHAGTRLMGAA